MRHYTLKIELGARQNVVVKIDYIGMTETEILEKV